MNALSLLSEQEYIRPTPRGIRPIGAGVIALARQLGLAWTLTKEQREQRPALDPQGAHMEAVALTWLLDEKHSIEEIKRGAAGGRERFFEMLTHGADGGYGFNVSLRMLALADAELKATNAALEAALFEIEPKPDHVEGASPQGKS